MLHIKHIFSRIEDKRADYVSYSFTSSEDIAFKTFFDLAQELDSIKELYALCVAIPKSFFELDASLYLINPRDGNLMLITSSSTTQKDSKIAPEMPSKDMFYTDNNTLVLKIRGKSILMEHLPFSTDDDVIGLLEVYPAEGLTPHKELFLKKYANRLGYNIHNRILVDKNIDHLRFIRTLVADIGHNIIAPNIIYKLYIYNLNMAISKNKNIENKLKNDLKNNLPPKEILEEVVKDLSESNQALSAELQEISKHHSNMSLFLETLLRRSHFDQGRLVLRTKKCNMKRDVVAPQLERFSEQFRSMGITVDDRSSGLPEEEIISVVDVGLMSQVYANLFSNAIKYTDSMETLSADNVKLVSYGYESIKDFFGPQKDGLKYNVYNTGRHILEEERKKVFDDHYRGSNVQSQPGSGHGLSFIKNVVELHGGISGYEPTQYGNNFYFILPRET